MCKQIILNLALLHCMATLQWEIKMNYNNWKRKEGIAVESNPNLIIFLISNGNGHANKGISSMVDTEIFYVCSPLIFFLLFSWRIQGEAAVGCSWGTHITGIQVGSLGSDQHWGVRDRGVFVLHLLILGFVFFLREAAKGKSQHCNFRSIWQAATKAGLIKS